MRRFGLPDKRLATIAISESRRAGDFLRNVRRVFRRAGGGGLIELVAARTLPEALSYERFELLATSLDGGELHPELRPRRLDSVEPALDAFDARLASAREPGVPAYTREAVERRFAAGQELWVFHLNGRIGHARWVVREHLYIAGLVIPLRAGECATDGAVTLPEFRRRGVAVAARQHVRAMLGLEGANTMLSAVSPINRCFLATVLGIEGIDRVATLHVVRVAQRRWLRAVAASPLAAALLQRSGLRTNRWVRARDPRPPAGRQTAICLPVSDPCEGGSPDDGRATNRSA